MPPRRPPSVLLELHSADRTIRTLVMEAFAREGVRPNLFAILALIEIHEPITPTRLGEESGLRPSTLRDMVTEMVEAGHVVRVENESDRRSHFLATTPRARAFLRRADQIVAGVERRLEAELGISVEELRAPLSRLRRAARALLVN